MAVRLPGGVRSTDSFWDLLLSQRDVSREVPQDRYNIDAFYSDSQSRAVKSVASKECSSAIVAGSSIVLTPTMTKCMSENLALAPDEACKTFDREADGFARGEAVNALYIKRLDDAVRDGDPIRPVIRSTMNSYDGQTSQMAIPSAAAQESLIRNAYTRAGHTSKSIVVSCIVIVPSNIQKQRIDPIAMKTCLELRAKLLFSANT
ncbi:uncharacterized protein ATNIH1004_002945 [Aspergillus tanneri]|uniref:Ketosynthase family 3 (KS3) domain-containing protein n=1 Tax=Aspergillus tanneri TaxID=1220188 RepID=A0A5M9MZE5_9EURO|nr:uncharacterized protein ATNIH1004_002945 [Aspergillus tanneri]KAA8650263.1 hypothetical protein ATNIH1004_002945 [Aspergillus tanneri]